MPSVTCLIASANTCATDITSNFSNCLSSGISIVLHTITLLMLEEHIVPGVTTLDLDRLAEEFILCNKSKPGFKGLYDYIKKYY